MCRAMSLTNVVAAIFVVLLLIINGTKGITNGKLVLGHKRYMVYLLKAVKYAVPEHNFSDWMCAGAIIHPKHIVTSASCLYDMPHVYVVNGYNKYVNADRIEDDECIVKKRKRIVHVCTSENFSTRYRYEYNDYWSWADIIVARVDTAFDYNDMSYYKYCTYPPAAIKVNVNGHYTQGDGLDMLTYGWGHSKYYRPNNLDFDMNEKYLRYSASRTLNIKSCYNDFFVKSIPKFESHCKRFFICGARFSNMDENGTFVPYEPVACANETGSLRNYPQHLDANNETWVQDVGGFCQNDHGGPLVAYIGGHEMLIGVSTVFMVTKNMECVAPYMYTGLRCIGKIVHCVLYPDKFRRSFNCDGTAKSRRVVERNITWPDDH